MPGRDSLEFRDVHALSRSAAYVLSAGPGARSRIYQTTNGGARWQLQFMNQDSSAFFDCFDFWDEQRGIVVSDAVAGHLLIITTANGRDWAPVLREQVPAALEGEGAFAASGTCLIARPPGYAWIGTGAGGQARVYRSADAGQSWTVARLPFRGDPRASGVVTVAFRDSLHGAALGGEISVPNSWRDNVAVTADGGRTWGSGSRPPFPGAVYGSAYVPGTDPPILVAVGPGGAAYSRDDGQTWKVLSSQGYWAVAFAGRRGWMVGEKGKITRIEF
jgi:photosystem II stability/assembly factor-like uncharacterized protein